MKFVMVSVLVAVAAPAVAQEGGEQPADPRAAHRPLTWSVRVPTELGFNAGLDNSPGDVTVSRLGAEFGVGIPIATMAQLELGFEYEYSRYEFSNATGFVAGSSSPWQDIHNETVRARFYQQHDRQLGWFVGGSIGLSHEEGADLGDALHAGVFGGVMYNLSESVRIGGLLGVRSRIEDDPWFIAVPTIDWQIDPQWRLTNAGKPGLTLFYSPSEQWTLSLGAWYESRDFRLDSNGPVPDGVGRDQSVPIALGATFRPTSNMTLDFGAGVRVLGNLELENSTGGRVADIDVDPAAFLSFAVGVKF